MVVEWCAAAPLPSLGCECWSSTLSTQHLHSQWDVCILPAAPRWACVPAQCSHGPVPRKPGTSVTCQAWDASADGHGLFPPLFLSHCDFREESCCSGRAWCSAGESIQRGGLRSQVLVWLHLCCQRWGGGWIWHGKGLELPGLGKGLGARWAREKLSLVFGCVADTVVWRMT